MSGTSTFVRQPSLRPEDIREKPTIGFELQSRGGAEDHFKKNPQCLRAFVVQDSGYSLIEE